MEVDLGADNPIWYVRSEYITGQTGGMAMDSHVRGKKSSFRWFLLAGFILLLVALAVPMLATSPPEGPTRYADRRPTGAVMPARDIGMSISGMIERGELTQANASNGCYLVNREHWDSLGAEGKEMLTRLCAAWQRERNASMPNIMMLDSTTEAELALYSFSGQHYRRGFTLYR
jgi:hypothetical protein